MKAISENAYKRGRGIKINQNNIRVSTSDGTLIYGYVFYSICRRYLLDENWSHSCCTPDMLFDTHINYIHTLLYC